MRHTGLKIPQRILGAFIDQACQRHLAHQWQSYIKQKELLSLPKARSNESSTPQNLKQDLGLLIQIFIAFSNEYLTHINKSVAVSNLKEESLFTKRYHDLDCVFQTLRVLHEENYINLSILIDLHCSEEELKPSSALGKAISMLQEMISHDVRYCLLHESSLKVSGSLISFNKANLAKMGLLFFGFISLELSLEATALTTCIMWHYFLSDVVSGSDGDKIRAFNNLLRQVGFTIYNNQDQESCSCLLGFVVRGFTKLLLQSVILYKLDWQVIKNNRNRLKSLLTILIKKISNGYMRRIDNVPSLSLVNIKDFFYWHEHVFINYVFAIVLKDNFPEICSKLVAWFDDIDDTAKNLIPTAYCADLDTLKQACFSHVSEFKELTRIERSTLYPLLFNRTATKEVILTHNGQESNNKMSLLKPHRQGEHDEELLLRSRL